MCVLCTSLHLIAIFWKKVNVEGIGFLLWDQCLMFLCFYSLWNLTCVSSDWYSIKTQRDHEAVVELFLWVAPSSLMRCHTDYSLPGLPAHQFSIQIFARMFMVPLPLAAPWKPPEGRELRSHQVWCVCSPSLEEPSPGTLTLPAVQGLRTGSYFVQLSNSQ